MIKRLRKILADIAVERLAQDQRFGPQSWPDGTSEENTYMANYSRTYCDLVTERGDLTWADILTEEFFEALAETDPDKLRTELIQLAAVAANWVQDIDQRAP